MLLENIIIADSRIMTSLEKSLSTAGLTDFKLVCIDDLNVPSFLESARDHLKQFCIVTSNQSLRKFYPNNVVYISLDYDIVKITKEIIWIMTGFGKNIMTDNIFFWSDPHFYHDNIIKYCNRPWNSGFDSDGNYVIDDACIEKMNDDLISRFNSVVPADGITWCLGDFCLGPNQKKHIPEILSRLNGKVNLVLGNHDHHSIKFYYDAGFNKVYDRPIVINDFVILSHAPLEFVKAPFFNIYGHVHDCSTYNTWSNDSCCVCVERHDYCPVSWKAIYTKYKELHAIAV